MTALEIIHIVLKTTEDTSTILYRCLKETSKANKQIVLKELNRPFAELEEEYIDPILYHIEDRHNYSLNFHYKKGKDDKHIIDNDLLQEEATMKWLSRKKSELKKSLTLIDVICYETIKIEKFDIIADELFDNLIKHKFINDQKDRELFTSIFTGNIIYEQPKIKWLKGIQYYNMFFHILEHHGLFDFKRDSINAKALDGQFFVNAEDEDKIIPFERLSKRKKEFAEKTSYYYNRTTFKEREDFKDLKDLEDIIKKLRKN